MKNFKLCMLFLLLFSTSLFAYDRALKDEVDSFLEDLKTCIHFRGEIEGGLSERQVFVTNKVSEYCIQAKVKHDRLIEKYKNNQYVEDVLKKHQEEIDDM